MRFFKSQKGQSLLELVIGIGVGVIFLSGALGIIALSLRVNFQNQSSQVASELGQEKIDQLTVFSRANWHNLSALATSTPYHLNVVGSFFQAVSGTEIVTLDDKDYTRSFTVEEVQRSQATDEIVASGGQEDPSTMLLRTTITWAENDDIRTITLEKYLTRLRDRDFPQTDWSGGPGVEGPVTIISNTYATSTNLTVVDGSLQIQNLSAEESSSTVSNIDPVFRYTWSDIGGWFDFKVNNTVTVSSTKILGYAFSTDIGNIALDCSTAPNGDVCDQSNFFVSNDGTGVLGGFAWNDQIGWIQFADNAPLSYGVTIDSEGFFNGWAWNDVVGWISFNCDNTHIGNTCKPEDGGSGTSTYKLKTTWGLTAVLATLTSSIYDTQSVDGAAFNTLMWQGLQPSGSAVKFQVATSDCANGASDPPSCVANVGWGGAKTSGPGAFIGPTGDNLSFYDPAGPDVQVRVNRAFHNDDRYVRYMLTIESDPTHQFTPRVDDVIINWSL